MGPPREGEQTFTAYGQDGAPRIFEVVADKTVETGPLSGKVPSGVKWAEPAYFTVQGSVRDEAGKPFVGAKIIAFKAGDPARRPAFTFNSIAKDGAYQLKLSADSSYAISARANYGGGQPETGEYIGRYGDKDVVVVTGKSGEVLKNLDITMRKVPERFPQGEVENPLRKQQPGSTKELKKSSEPEPK